MTLCRYELFVEDEPQEVGFMVGINELDLDEDEQFRVLQQFNDELIHPPCVKARFFFTDYGDCYFAKAIQKLIRAYKKSIFDVHRIDIELSESEMSQIVYQDEFQVAIPEELYKQLMVRF